jgi:hypothetical protein
VRDQDASAATRKPTLAFRSANEVLVVAHTREKPAEHEFDAYIEAARRLQERFPGKGRCLVLTDGGGPDGAQRETMAKRVNLQAFPAAVVSSSASVRFIVSTFAFFNPRIQTFAPTEIARAYAYLELDRHQIGDLPDVFLQLKRELGGTAVLDVVCKGSRI